MQPHTQRHTLGNKQTNFALSFVHFLTCLNRCSNMCGLFINYFVLHAVSTEFQPFDRAAQQSLSIKMCKMCNFVCVRLVCGFVCAGFFSFAIQCKRVTQKQKRTPLRCISHKTICFGEIFQMPSTRREKMFENYLQNL